MGKISIVVCEDVENVIGIGIILTEEELDLRMIELRFYEQKNSFDLQSMGKFHLNVFLI